VRDGQLTDGDVAVLSRQAVDLLGPDVDVEITPSGADDPYRWGRQSWLVWPRVDGARAFGIRLHSGLSPAQALAALLDGLSDEVSETRRFWGEPFPRCPGHAHPARVAAEAGEVVESCPHSAAVVARIAPDVAG
jgi:hypothetical protein